MTEWLVRRFVKTPDDLHNQEVRTAYGSMAGGVGIAANLLLFFVKLLAGFLSGSVSVTADAFNNLSDAVSSVTGFLAAKLSAKPADEEHPFGHGRIEYVAAFVVAFLVLEVGVSLFKSSLQKLLSPEALTVSMLPVLILVLSVLLKLWLSRFDTVLGRRIGSGVLLAAAADARSDALAGTATILALLVYAGTGLNIDGICGLLVSLLVLKTGVEIARDTLEPIIGGRPDPALCEQITEFVRSYQGVLGVHDLIVNNYGPSAQIASIHVELSSEMSLDEAHRLLDQIEIDARHKLGLLLVTHTDPIDLKDPEAQSLRELIRETIRKTDPAVSCHDVRLVRGAHGANIVFDLVVPWQYRESDTDRVIEAIRKKTEEKDAAYRCIVTVEHSYSEGNAERGGSYGA